MSRSMETRLRKLEGEDLERPVRLVWVNNEAEADRMLAKSDDKLLLVHWQW